MEKVRYGIVGIGVMGTGHAKSLSAGKDPNAVLAAVCDTDPARIEWAKENLDVPIFTDYKELYKSGLVDAVIIAVPHYDHPRMTMEAFDAGLHVLVEKPAGVYTKQVEEMNAAAKKTDKKFAIMFLQRRYPLYQKIKDLLVSGELGNLKRIQWTVTTWYRPQSYHDSSNWRSCWAGEGGGVLINQCPHNLDLWQWLFGMPDEVYTEMSFGKYYNIEVEDDVTAFFKYDNGVTGTFIASTGEAPGTNRLEIAGDMGKIVVDNCEKITFMRNRVSEREFNAKWTAHFGVPECWTCNIPFPGVNEAHLAIIKNFSDAIANDAEIFVPGEEGIKSLSLSNAMHLSAWTGSKIRFPIDADAYYKQLQEKIKNSTYKKTVRKTDADLGSSFKA